MYYRFSIGKGLMCVIDIPDDIFFLYIQVGSEKVNFEAFIFFLMHVHIPSWQTFPGNPHSLFNEFTGLLKVALTV